jgi:hypothetical protein
VGASDLPGKPDDLESPGVRRAAADQNGPSDRVRADVRTGLQQRLKQFRDGHPSSPNHEDGSPKPPIANLSEFESASAGDEPAGGDELESSPVDETTDRVGQPHHADGAARRGEGEPESPGDGSEGWLAALPRLQELWERHIDNWPDKQRSPVDRSEDEPGSWRGDAGHYLNYEENLVTEHALDRVSKAEPEVTRTMKAVEADVPGARLVGLQYCLKGEDRLKEKVAASLAIKPERAVGKETDATPDALRYTYQFSNNSYVDGYRITCGQLQERGCRMLFSRNSWESHDYKGVNTRWRTAEGQLFEVQFHTAESFEAKQLTHSAYERLRNPLTGKREMSELREFQRLVADRVPVPDRASEIRDLRKG